MRGWRVCGDQGVQYGGQGVQCLLQWSVASATVGGATATGKTANLCMAPSSSCTAR